MIKNCTFLSWFSKTVVNALTYNLRAHELCWLKFKKKCALSKKLPVKIYLIKGSGKETDLRTPTLE